MSLLKKLVIWVLVSQTTSKTQSRDIASLLYSTWQGKRPGRHSSAWSRDRRSWEKIGAATDNRCSSSPSNRAYKIRKTSHEKRKERGKHIHPLHCELSHPKAALVQETNCRTRLVRYACSRWVRSTQAKPRIWSNAPAQPAGPQEILPERRGGRKRNQRIAQILCSMSYFYFHIYCLKCNSYLGVRLVKLLRQILLSEIPLATTSLEANANEHWWMNSLTMQKPNDMRKRNSTNYNPSESREAKILLGSSKLYGSRSGECTWYQTAIRGLITPIISERPLTLVIYYSSCLLPMHKYSFVPFVIMDTQGLGM